MTHFHDPERPYSRAEVLSDAAVHLGALGAALAAVPVLITLGAVWQLGAGPVTGLAVYGGSLIVMLLCSYLYNHVRCSDCVMRLRTLDQSAIFVKIAGTYTPFALISGTGFGLLTAIWSGAALGVVLAALRGRGSVLPCALLCLGLGWAIVVGGQTLLATLSMPVIVLMAVGGVLYSVGVPFLLAKRMPYHNTIWHGFVVVASVLYFIAIFVHMVQTAAPVT
ncbi:hypothetical protein Dshi_2910 [Dinoroseobacter shibae DFL 12 = DSM 16493]|jgi:hemolysin III|uniref:Hly-III family protein n=1 Tax=Dinoroseobacter shibae (strain DSM 16493 / NCIMB 14021 / DFL 12) TaxID=398580 RepID=A8LJP0_DINSH|nr:hemolysin III family protein [Dinoroseobacter shibae]ABV94643.1 hypothetical protein Dshi_2910 [Dinoroseobacter shibae DFL 12 = DSM 16493]URF46069.1 hemolysin III family protein [Dinoroseobacter shibae]URF50375.1 hemolysin III family protein [Dinoroseobacter shibae]